MNAEQLKAAIEYAQQFEEVGGMDDLGRTITKCSDQLVTALSAYESSADDRQARIDALRETQNLRDQLRWLQARVAELESDYVKRLEADILAYRELLHRIANDAHSTLDMRNRQQD